MELDGERTKDYRLTLRVHNNRLLECIELSGYRSIKHFTEIHVLAYNTVCDLVSMRKPAWSVRYNRWTRSALRVSDALGVDPEDLFTEIQAGSSGGLVFERRLNEDDFRQLSSGSIMCLPVEDVYDQKELVDTISSQLQSLPKEGHRKALEMRFGLNGSREMTLEQIGERLGIRTERARQWVEKGLRLLRHPSRSRHFRPFTESR